MTHGEVRLIDFGDPVGSLPSKIRPAVVMQNDLLGTKNLNTVVDKMQALCSGACFLL